MSGSTQELSPKQIEQRRAARTTHAAQSEAGLRARKTRLKRAFLKARGVRESDLDPAGLDLLDTYVGVAAKVEALDGWFDEHGMIDASTGEPAPPTRLYVAVLNSKQRALVRLEAHVAKLPALDPQAVLRAYLAGDDHDA